MADRSGVGYSKGVTEAPPIPFRLEDAGPSVQLRIVRDLWGDEPPESLVRDVIAQPEVARLANTQRRDGTWASWLHRAGLSTENAITTLAELGCPFGAPLPWARAIPPLEALLEGERTPFVDLRQPASPEIMTTRHRRIAAGLLAHLGMGRRKSAYRAVEREVSRAHAFVRRARLEGVPVRSEKRASGAMETVWLPEALDTEGLPVPDLYWLRAVAFSPGRARDPRVREILRFVAGPEYGRLANESLGLLTTEGRRVRPGFGIRRLEPVTAMREGQIGEALLVAELLARAGDVTPARHLVRFLDAHRDGHGRVALPANAFRRGGEYVIQRGWTRLSTPWRPRARTIDATFRTLLLTKLSGARAAMPE
jgi:hypothetical protein